jgi:hypothetical protein
MNKQTRGERNFNPGNLRRTSVMWQGMSDAQSDVSFITFKNAMWGIRALAKTLITYYRLHELRTVAAIIDRWAPTNENDTHAYINAVSSDMRVSPSDLINLESNTTLEALVRAIIKHENGRIAYDDETLQAGVDSALAKT